MSKVKMDGQGKLFRSNFLELYTKTNPVIHVITYGGAMVFFSWFADSNAEQRILYFLLGAVGWTLTEYIMHRYLFHIKPGKFQYLIHGVHHEYPRDKERLMMPPLPGILLLCIFTAFWYILFRDQTFAYMTGFVGGYMAYTFIHFIVHAWKPIPGIKFLWTHHHKHHNPAFENKAFGVSSPLWDIVFGTLPPKSGKQDHKA